jgi:uncharacterized membrane protein
MNDVVNPKSTPKDYNTVMAHFYRGELGRIMIWRQRLDVTTNWAILGCTGMITFGLGSPNNTPLIFLFAHFLTFLLLSIEARRYRYYDAFRARVRMLEAHFIMPMVMQEDKILQGDWRRIMSEDLMLPTFKISKKTAILKRFRRNYVWIFLLISLAWITKVWIHYPDSHSFNNFAGSFATHHPLSPTIFWTLIGAIYLLLGIMTTASVFMRRELGEFSTKAMHRRKWNI